MPLKTLRAESLTTTLISLIKEAAMEKALMNWEDGFEEARANHLAKNKEFLALFKEDMVSAGFSKSTISKHLSNVSDFLNDYLLGYEIIPMEEGIKKVSIFFFQGMDKWIGYDRAAMAAGIKKFYTSMNRHGLVSDNEFSFMLEELASIRKNGYR